MKLKKIAIPAAISLALILGACGSNDENKAGSADQNQDAETENVDSTAETQEKIVEAGDALQDGTYTLAEKDLDKNGWKVEMSITVKDGKITESTYDYVNADGDLKSEDEEYQKLMKEKSGIGPAEFIPQLNEALIAAQNAQDVEIISGATHSAEAFKNYAQQLIQAAQKGDTTPIEIHNMDPMQDGEYSLSELNYSNGYRVTIKMTVEDGKIVAAEYDNIDKDGNSKADNEEYQKSMTEKSGIGPKEFIPAFGKSLVEAQDAAAVEVVTGATHSAHTFKVYAAQLINAAQKGDTTPIEVSNFVYAK